MFGEIPIIKVEYTITQLLKAVFVSEKSQKYRDLLKTQICSFFGTDNCILTSSARCALFMILKSLPQRKVIVPAYTCEVVVEAVKLAHKELIFAHVQKDTLNISEYPKIDSDTIVIATHQYGLPCEMSSIVDECRKKGAILIEDCAGSLGSTINGQLTGTFGDYGVFSFSASKTLHSPTKGGFIIAKQTSELQKVATAISLKPNNNKFKFKHILKGVGFCLNKNEIFCKFLSAIKPAKDIKLNDLHLNDKAYTMGFYEWQAFVVSLQFTRLNTILADRKLMFKMYNEGIVNSKIKKPLFNSEAVNIRYAVLVDNRFSFLSQCRANGIQVGEGYNKLMCPSDYDNEFEISQEIVYLPFGHGYTHKEIQKVIAVVNSVVL